MLEHEFLSSHRLLVLISANSILACFLSSDLLAFLSLNLLVGGHLFGSLALDFVDFGLTLALDSQFCLFLLLDDGQLVIFLLLGLLFLHLFEVVLKLINSASMLVSQFLELGAVLFLLFALRGALVFVLFTHQLSHQLIRLFASIIGKFLELLNNLDSICTASLFADGHGCITGCVALENVELSILEHVHEAIVVHGVPSGQVNNVVVCTRLTNAVIGLLGKEFLDDFEFLVRADKSELQRREALELWLEGPTLGSLSVSRLDRLDVD